MLDLTEAILVTREVVGILRRLGIDCGVAGSLASSTHGVPRSTNDIDLIADIRPEQVGDLVRAFEAAYYVSETAVSQAVSRRSTFNLIDNARAIKVDVYVVGRGEYEKAELANRKEVPIEGGEPIPVISAEDTVLSKLLWFRKAGGTSQRQWKDVLGVLTVQKDRLDETYMDRWAERIGVMDLLARARADAVREGN